MAFDTRNKCRICGMTCDFPGQVYCRNCLNKKRRQEELRERVERKRERELNNQGPKVSLNHNDSIILIKTFAVAFIIVFAISFFVTAAGIKGKDGSNTASKTNNGGVIFSLEGNWSVVGYVDFYELLSNGHFKSEGDWQSVIPDELVQAESNKEIIIKGQTLKKYGDSYTIKEYKDNVFSFSSNGYDGSGLICLADDGTLHEYSGGELYIYQRH